MRRFLIVLLLMLAPVAAKAALPVYTGSFVKPAVGTMVFTGAGTGCLVTDTNGNVTAAVCPTGTAAIAGTSPIVITGTNPYFITCPTCLATAAGNYTLAGNLTFNGNNIFNGSNIFNGPTTFNALITATAGITSSSTSVPVTIGASGSYTTGGLVIGTSGGIVTWTTQAAAGCQGVAGSAMHMVYNATPLFDLDTSGNVGYCGVAYSASSEKFKTNITHLTFDALKVNDSLDYVSFHYKLPYGDPKPLRYGILADHAPAFISGPKHNRVDWQALAVTQGLAIKQLEKRIKVLEAKTAGIHA